VRAGFVDCAGQLPASFGRETVGQQTSDRLMTPIARGPEPHWLGSSEKLVLSPSDLTAMPARRICCRETSSTSSALFGTTTHS
jgi:hypothetical protein